MLGKTQSDIAQIMQVSLRTVQNWENSGEVPLKYEAQVDWLTEQAAIRYLHLFSEKKNYDLVSRKIAEARKELYGEPTLREPESEYKKGEEIRREKVEGKQMKGTIAVPIKAQANYAKNIFNPVYLNNLERFYFPNNPYDGDKYRFFQMEGDSMEYIDENGKVAGLPDGSWIIAEEVPQEDWRHNLRKYYVHVVVTNSRITIKRILQDNDADIVLHADNELYGQERIPLSEVKEIWIFKRRLDWNAPPPRKIEITV